MLILHRDFCLSEGLHYTRMLIFHVQDTNKHLCVRAGVYVNVQALVSVKYM